MRTPISYKLLSFGLPLAAMGFLSGCPTHLINQAPQTPGIGFSVTQKPVPAGTAHERQLQEVMFGVQWPERQVMVIPEETLAVTFFVQQNGQTITSVTISRSPEIPHPTKSIRLYPGEYVVIAKAYSTFLPNENTPAIAQGNSSFSVYSGEETTVEVYLNPAPDASPTPSPTLFPSPSPTPSLTPMPSPSPTPTPFPIPTSDSTGTQLAIVSVDTSYKQPTRPAVDKLGNLWFIDASIYVANVVKVNNGNFEKKPTLSDNNPSDLMFDNNNNLWMCFSGDDSVKKYNSSLSLQSTYYLSLVKPVGVDIDNQGRIWVACNTQTENIIVINPNGSISAKYTVPFPPSDIAIDLDSNHAWMSTSSTNSVYRLNIQTGAQHRFTVSYSTAGITVDNAGYIWVTHTPNHSLSKINHEGTIIGTFSAGKSPSGVYVDRSSGYLWVANRGNGSIIKVHP